MVLKEKPCYLGHNQFLHLFYSNDEGWRGRRRMSVKEWGWGRWCETGSDSYAHLCMTQTEADRCLENPLENGQNFTVPKTFD